MPSATTHGVTSEASLAPTALDRPQGRRAPPRDVPPSQDGPAPEPTVESDPPARPPAAPPPQRGSGAFRCVMCGGPVVRVRRRFVDRLISIVRPTWRFRCVSRTCGWEGRGPQAYH